MNKEEVLERCKDLVLDGKEYHEIKARLEKMQLDVSLIKLALKQTDEWIVSYELEQQIRERYFIQAGIGIVLMVLAILLSLFSTINTIILGCITLVGAWIAYGGYKKYQAPPTLSTVITEKKKGKFERF